MALFAHKVALVTGGSRGIGKAISLKLAGEGADVVVNYFRNRRAAEETAGELEAKGVKAHLIKANVGEPEKIVLMFDEVRRTFGRLDILINNAASGVARSALELDARGWDWTMDINARAALLCSQQAASLMPGEGGKIVNISSLGSFLVWSRYAAVGVSKAALEALTRYLAIELAPRRICVNAVSASGVRTAALERYVLAGQSPLGAAGTPAGRMVAPEDVANVVAFLCSEDASMIRGQTIIVDGGTSIAPFTAPPPEAGDR